MTDKPFTEMLRFGELAIEPSYSGDRLGCYEFNCQFDGRVIWFSQSEASALHAYLDRWNPRWKKFPESKPDRTGFFPIYWEDDGLLMAHWHNDLQEWDCEVRDWYDIPQLLNKEHHNDNG